MLIMVIHVYLSNMKEIKVFIVLEVRFSLIQCSRLA